MSTSVIQRLLLVEDNLDDAFFLRRVFNERGTPSTEVTHVTRMSEAEQHLATRQVDIMLLDLGLPDAQGAEAVRRAHAAAPHVPLVVLTGLADEAVAASRSGNGAWNASDRIAIARFFAETIAVQSPSLEISVTESAEAVTNATLPGTA